MTVNQFSSDRLMTLATFRCQMLRCRAFLRKLNPNCVIFLVKKYISTMKDEKGCSRNCFSGSLEHVSINRTSVSNLSQTLAILCPQFHAEEKSMEDLREFQFCRGKCCAVSFSREMPDAMRDLICPWRDKQWSMAIEEAAAPTSHSACLSPRFSHVTSGAITLLLV